VKHTKPMLMKTKNTVFKDGVWWYMGVTSRGDGERQTLESYTRKNKRRMFVGGKYIPKSHPLHRPGCYKDFEEAAFNALDGYAKSQEGHVYVASNPAWLGWYKVGMAVDAEDRCRSYQTSSPYRDFKLEYFKIFDDRRKAENNIHLLLSALGFDRLGEWFKAPLPLIKQEIKGLEA
jgi:hypothetical protein